MFKVDDVARLEEVIDRFEEAWQHGEKPAIDSYLSEDGDSRAAPLRISRSWARVIAT